MFEGFVTHRIDHDGVPIHAVVGGEGPPLLLLHGHPQTHVIWHKVVGELARHFTVVATDLRGYGDSGKPAGLPDHSNYSKRVMAADQLAVMRGLGFERFRVLAHDRGARVAHRLAVDHPQAVEKLVTLDIAPTLAMYNQTNEAFARAYYHWFFLIRPAPFPETLIEADPALYLRQTMGGRSAGMTPFTEAALAEYLRCLKLPGAAHGLCEDYRASAGIDLEHDRADIEAGRRVECDMLALWGANGAVEQCFSPLEEWRKVARQVSGHAMPCGHYIAEEVPEQLLAEALPFLRG
ncbi:alpha/beta fold hydrolase [Cupriavidus pauculus]|uniref:Alpha/beta hydrolase n=1 Tax=Cupriavidus pauculus TaxID=82633 RepID=A0A2N5CIX5_9BURK|nr:alpha/beta hydrolase [Cupriavidus pauculus]PLQ02125.1 alpha/beta hydrolase [Cupriavidus pauculus]